MRAREPERSPSPASSRGRGGVGNHAPPPARPRAPDRPLRGSGAAAPSSSPHPLLAAPAWAARRARSGPRILGRWPCARQVAMGARGPAAGSGPRRAARRWPGRPLTEVHGLVALGALGGHGRRAQSARVLRPRPSPRCRRRRALPACRAVRAPIGSAAGAGRREPALGSGSPGRRGGGGAPAGADGGSGETRSASPGRAREVPSTQARPLLARFHDNVGAASGTAGWGRESAGPLDRGSPGQLASVRKGGVPTRRLTATADWPVLPDPGAWVPGGPYPTLPRAAARFPLFLGFYSNPRAWIGAGFWMGAPPGSDPHRPHLRL